MLVNIILPKKKYVNNSGNHKRDRGNVFSEKVIFFLTGKTAVSHTTLYIVTHMKHQAF